MDKHRLRGRRHRRLRRHQGGDQGQHHQPQHRQRRAVQRRWPLRLRQQRAHLADSTHERDDQRQQGGRDGGRRLRPRRGGRPERRDGHAQHRRLRRRRRRLRLRQRRRRLGQAAFKNSIVADNVATNAGSEDCYQASGGAHNVVGLGGGRANPDVGTANPRLGPLAANGGPTKTHALKAGSPAIGKTGDSAPRRDQRGRERDPDPDAGAYERGARDARAITRRALGWQGLRGDGASRTRTDDLRGAMRGGVRGESLRSPLSQAESNWPGLGVLARMPVNGCGFRWIWAPERGWCPSIDACRRRLGSPIHAQHAFCVARVRLRCQRPASETISTISSAIRPGLLVEREVTRVGDRDDGHVRALLERAPLVVG